MPFSWSHAYVRTRFRMQEQKRFRELQHLRQADADVTLLPFDHHECIYIHVPKCAGTAITHCLFGNRAGTHHDVWTYLMVFSPREFQRYFKFTFVRNPWDRLNSSFHFLRTLNDGSPAARWAARHLHQYTDFSMFVRKGLRQHLSLWLKQAHFNYQHAFLCIDGIPLVDFLGYYENLDEDYRQISERLGISRSLARMNTGPYTHRDFREEYTHETRKIVEEVYQEDIRLWGYDFDNTRLPRQLHERDSLCGNFNKVSLLGG